MTENLADRRDGYVLREQLNPADLPLSSGPKTVPLLLTSDTVLLIAKVLRVST